MDIRIDWAFKHVFSKKEHLRKIIRDLIEIDIEVLEYLPNGLDVASEQDKKSVFDVLCKNTATEEVFVLEMQTSRESDMNDRLFYYGGSLIHNQVKSGDDVYTVKTVYILCIASYRVPHNQPVPRGKVFFEYKMMERTTHEIFDGDKLQFYFLELERFDYYLDSQSDLKEQWCWIFNNMAIFAEKPAALDASFDGIIDDASTRRLTLEEREAYMEARHLNEREKYVIFEGGKQEGIELGIEKVAKKMLNLGLDIELIKTATGLSEQTINALRESW